MLDKDLPKRGDVVAGKYQIDGILGSGGMGAVYRATHRVTGKQFAIKWLLPRLSAESDAVKRFIREAQVAGRVDHPNVVEVYDVGQDGSSFFMVMELLQGESLAHRLASKQRLNAAEIAQILIPVTRGLAAAHKAGVIHRDLKPDNIFLCRTHEGDDLPKVLDFGISKMSTLDGDLSTGITRHGAIMGTPHYMSPEQVRALPVDARTDVYALGVILYQALTGDVPFSGDSYGDLVVKIMSESPKPLATVAPETPASLVQLVERCMARDPAQRPGSALELGLALQQYAPAMRFDSNLPAARTEPPPTAAATSETPLSSESHVPPMPSRVSLWLGSRPGRALVGAFTGTVLALIGVTVYDLVSGKPAAHGGGARAAVVEPKPEVVMPRAAEENQLKPAPQEIPANAAANAEDPLPITDTVPLDAGAARPPAVEAAAAEPAKPPDLLAPAPAHAEPPTQQQAKILPKAKPLAPKPPVSAAPERKPDPAKPGRTTKLSVNDFM